MNVNKSIAEIVYVLFLIFQMFFCITVAAMVGNVDVLYQVLVAFGLFFWIILTMHAVYWVMPAEIRVYWHDKPPQKDTNSS